MNSAEEKIEKIVNINLIRKLLTSTDSPPAKTTIDIATGAR